MSLLLATGSRSAKRLELSIPPAGACRCRLPRLLLQNAAAAVDCFLLPLLGLCVARSPGEIWSPAKKSEVDARTALEVHELRLSPLHGGGAWGWGHQARGIPIFLRCAVPLKKLLCTRKNSGNRAAELWFWCPRCRWGSHDVANCWAMFTPARLW